MQTEDLISNIDLDLSEASSTRPLLDNVTVKCRVGDSSISRTQTGLRRLVIPLITEEPSKDTSGKDVFPGFAVTHSFLLDEQGGWTKARAANELLVTKMAILNINEATAKATPTDATQWTGKFVLVTFVVGKDGTSQNVKRLSAVK